MVIAFLKKVLDGNKSTQNRSPEVFIISQVSQECAALGRTMPKTDRAVKVKGLYTVGAHQCWI